MDQRKVSLDNALDAARSVMAKATDIRRGVAERGGPYAEMLDEYAGEIGALTLRLFRDLIDTAAGEWDSMSAETKEMPVKDTEEVSP